MCVLMFSNASRSLSTPYCIEKVNFSIEYVELNCQVVLFS